MKRLVYIAGCSEDKSIGNYIKEDLKNIKSIFEKYENEGQVILRTDEFATKNSFVNRFRDEKILPWLFYFSGHSGPNFIEFSDGRIRSQNFLNIFRREAVLENLQLVYLGSCNSTDIGQELIDNNVKVVIASDNNVPPHLANIVSKLFFNRYLLSENIKVAFDMTENDYEIDRARFNVNEEYDFPWKLLTSSETNLTKPMKKMRLSSEQKHNLLMNSTSIRLEFLDYYLNEDKSTNKNMDLLKKETKSINVNLNSALKVDMRDANENLGNLIKVWEESKPLESFPDTGKFLRTNKKIGDLKAPEIFVENTRDYLSDLKDKSSDLLK